jgi:two-component system, chemotaxis family, chemotaxis protein CheY
VLHTIHAMRDHGRYSFAPIRLHNCEIYASTMRIMLVETSKIVRNIQREVLAECGYDIIEEACDGLDAMSKLDAFKPDLILLDWSLPHIDGLSIVKALRRRGRLTPMIMITMEADKDRVIEALNAGVNNYLIKPFTPEALAQRVEETIARGPLHSVAHRTALCSR